MTHHYPILEFDNTSPALIEPAQVLSRLEHMPEHLVLCFFQEVIDKTCQDAEVVTKLNSEIGRFPVYALEMDGQRIAVAHPGVGAPLSAAILEELIALGCRKIIACGGAGGLDGQLAMGHVVVPTSAIRDEGTSYHYLPPSREVRANPTAIAAIEATLQAQNIAYKTGKTWTTDGIYRETKAKIARRSAEGCLTVEMEAAAFFAVAQFREVIFGQILYSGDDVSGEEWDKREWQYGRPATREQLFWLATEACLRL